MKIRTGGTTLAEALRPTSDFAAQRSAAAHARRAPRSSMSRRFARQITPYESDGHPEQPSMVTVCAPADGPICRKCGLISSGAFGRCHASPRCGARWGRIAVRVAPDQGQGQLTTISRDATSFEALASSRWKYAGMPQDFTHGSRRYLEKEIRRWIH
jgi:hypothetical protein